MGDFGWSLHMQSMCLGGLQKSSPMGRDRKIMWIARGLNKQLPVGSFIRKQQAVPVIRLLFPSSMTIDGQKMSGRRALEFHVCCSSRRVLRCANKPTNAKDLYLLFDQLDKGQNCLHNLFRAKGCQGQ